MEEYDRLPSSRRSVSEELHNGQKYDVHSFNVILNKCNMDPISFIQPSIFGTVRVAEKFNLSIFKMHLVQMASAYVPNKKLFHLLAVEILLSCHINTLQPDQKGISLGRTVAVMARAMSQTYNGRSLERCPSYVSGDEQILTQETWAAMVQAAAVLGFILFKKYNTCTKSQQQSDSSKVR